MMIRYLLAAALAAVPTAPSFAQNADVEAGKRAFLQCRACHTVEVNGRSLNGPNLHGLFGSKAGTKAGFKYSPALANSGITWTDQQLDRWFANPRGAIPGNKMVFMGVRDPKVRRQLIAFLKVETAR